MRKEQVFRTSNRQYLKEYELGKAPKDIRREHGISAPTFYQWKQKYRGMDAQRLKELKYYKKKMLV
ncbi:transposase [Sphingobacterium paludis]|uniref:Putative transposase n=1 Tax=Sphingobacterium paludis TaxID=1476465 RepID=A0A4R7CVV5_9SPHI|nr:transposase [Sphingobacterium paludis]TDS06788.1 putative transposase [Sphingobacterium paludis]